MFPVLGGLKHGVGWFVGDLKLGGDGFWVWGWGCEILNNIYDLDSMMV